MRVEDAVLVKDRVDEEEEVAVDVAVGVADDVLDRVEDDVDVADAVDVGVDELEAVDEDERVEDALHWNTAHPEAFKDTWRSSSFAELRCLRRGTCWRQTNKGKRGNKFAIIANCSRGYGLHWKYLVWVITGLKVARAGGVPFSQSSFNRIRSEFILSEDTIETACWACLCASKSNRE